MAVSYPDAIGNYIASPRRFVTGGLQYVGHFEPAKITPGQVTHLHLFLQNNVNVPLTANLKINVPQSRGFLRGGKDLLAVGAPSLEVTLAAGEAGRLTLPVTTTEHTVSGKHSLRLEVKANSEGRAERVRPPKSKSVLGRGLIDNPVGLNLVSSLGATYAEEAVKKASFELEVAGQPQPSTETPQLNHIYESIWLAEEVRLFNQAVQELNLRRVQLRKEIGVEALYTNLFSESTVRFADAGLPLRIGEAIILAKILTYSCEYFLSDPNRRNGLLVPIWEQALREEVDTTDGLEVIRTVGYYHLLKFSVAISFGLIRRIFGDPCWSLKERQAVANHIADNIEAAQSLDQEFLYLPLLMAGTHIADRLKLKDENVGHTLTLLKQAREARTDLFADKDMAQAKEIYDHILKEAL